MLTVRSRVAFVAAVGLTGVLVLAGTSGARQGAAVIIVTTKADGADPTPGDGVCKAKLTVMQKPGAGTCTLRAAIQTANGRPGNDVVVLPAGTFTLQVAGVREDKSAKGDLDIRPDTPGGGGSVSLVGKGPAATIIDGGGIDRVFDVGIWGDLSVTGVTIRHGQAPLDAVGDGGGVRVLSRGTLTLLRVVLDSNTASGQLNNGGGLAIEAYGSARLARVSLLHNVASSGAGIYANGAVDLTNVTIAGNNALSIAGGLLLHNPQNTPVQSNFLHVTITGNTSAAGTAVYMSSDVAYLTLRSSVVEGSCGGRPLFSNGSNVFTDQSCGGLGTTVDKLAPDPGVGALVTDASGLPVAPLTAESPALDFAAGDTCPPIDERGAKRPQGAGCDSGAYELG
jgi:CSLREA domain-containing protein